jgi:hypothetical protein
MKTILLAAAALLVAAPAFAQAVDPCEILKIEEINTLTAGNANKMRANVTKVGLECSFLDAKQNAVLTVEIRGAKLPKAELDIEAENLQKIYRTSVKPVEIGDGGFWLTSKYELFFRKNKNIVRVVMNANADPKTIQARTESVGRLVETRLK